MTEPLLGVEVALSPARAGVGAELRVHAQPGAKRSAIAGLSADHLRIRVAAPPVDGKANEALLRYLADVLGVRGSSLSIVSGATSRKKRIRIDGLDPVEVARRLLAALAG